MTQHAPIFIVLLPLTASLLCMLFSRIKKELGAWIVMASIVGAFLSACTVLQRVIATGGGSVTIPKNYEPLHQNSIIFFLDRDIHKLPVKGRPVSQRDGVEQIYQKRKPLYLAWKTPGCHIRCPNSPNRTAQIIIQKIEKMDK